LTLHDQARQARFVERAQSPPWRTTGECLRRREPLRLAAFSRVLLTATSCSAFDRVGGFRNDGRERRRARPECVPRLSVRALDTRNSPSGKPME
jgi:hypothetical protein